MEKLYFEAEELLTNSEMFDIKAGEGKTSGSEMDVCGSGCILSCASSCTSCTTCKVCIVVAFDVLEGPGPNIQPNQPADPMPFE